MDVSLELRESTYKTLKKHLHSGDNLEAAAIMFCAFGKGANRIRLMVREIIPIPASKYKAQTPTYVSWPFAEYMGPEKISGIDKEGLSVFTIHSHPQGCNEFSMTDDENDRALFHSVRGWFDDDRLNGSAIMLPDGSVKARTYDKNEKFSLINSVSAIGEDIKIWKQLKRKNIKPDYILKAPQTCSKKNLNLLCRLRQIIPSLLCKICRQVKICRQPEPKKQTSDYTTRILQTFGKGTFNLLRQLKVGVVGCSGTGSIIVELLARNCIGSLVLIDPDIVEAKNLNRIVNTEKKDAEQGMLKVEVLKNAVEKMGMDVDVETYQADTYDTHSVELLTDCDVIFGCVDSAAGRYHLECISKAYFIPYFDVGVYLEADEEGGISQADVKSHYLHPESRSLLDRGVYTMDQVTSERLKRTDKDHYERQIESGYLKGVVEDQPAVISINMQAACLAFNDFLARIHGFRLDNNSEFETQTFQLVQGNYSHQDNGSDCNSIFEKYLGWGERSPLIQNLKRGKK